MWVGITGLGIRGFGWEVGACVSNIKEKIFDSVTLDPEDARNLALIYRKETVKLHKDQMIVLLSGLTQECITRTMNTLVAR